jgi:hypothetical protein
LFTHFVVSEEASGGTSHFCTPEAGDLPAGWPWPSGRRHRRRPGAPSQDRQKPHRPFHQGRARRDHRRLLPVWPESGTPVRRRFDQPGDRDETRAPGLGGRDHPRGPRREASRPSPSQCAGDPTCFRPSRAESRGCRPASWQTRATSPAATRNLADRRLRSDEIGGSRLRQLASHHR